MPTRISAGVGDYSCLDPRFITFYSYDPPDFSLYFTMVRESIVLCYRLRLSSPMTYWYCYLC